MIRVGLEVRILADERKLGRPFAALGDEIKQRAACDFHWSPLPVRRPESHSMVPVDDPVRRPAVPAPGEAGGADTGTSIDRMPRRTTPMRDACRDDRRGR